MKADLSGRVTRTFDDLPIVDVDIVKSAVDLIDVVSFGKPGIVSDK